jgi:hypothetical protein
MEERSQAVSRNSINRSERRLAQVREPRRVQEQGRARGGLSSPPTGSGQEVAPKPPAWTQVHEPQWVRAERAGGAEWSSGSRTATASGTGLAPEASAPVRLPVRACCRGHFPYGYRRRAPRIGQAWVSISPPEVASEQAAAPGLPRPGPYRVRNSQEAKPSLLAWPARDSAP